MKLVGAKIFEVFIFSCCVALTHLVTGGRLQMNFLVSSDLLVPSPSPLKRDGKT